MDVERNHQAQQTPRSHILYSMLLVLMLVGLFPLGINAYQLISSYAGELTSSVQELQNQILSNVAEMTAAYLHHYRTKLKDIAEGYSMTLTFLASGDLFDSVLNGKNLEERIKEDHNIIKLGSLKAGTDEGRQAAQQNIQDPTINSFILAGAKEAKEGRFYMSSPYYYTPMRETLVVMAAPIRSLDRETTDEVLGVVFGVISLNELQIRLSENVRQGLELFILDDRDNLVAHTDPMRLQLAAAKGSRIDYSTHPLVRQFHKMHGVASLTPSPYDMTEAGAVRTFIGTVMPVPGGRGWAAYGQSDREIAYGWIREQQRKSVMAVLVVFAMVIIVGVVFGFSISRPIKLLAEGSMRLAHGDYDQRIDFQADNELGQLADTFNYMSREIQEREKRLKQSAEENRQLFMGTIRTLAAAIDAKDPYTKGHSDRVTYYTLAIAKEMGLPQEQVETLRISALLHDVGKIGIDDSILRKPGALTEEEYEVMKGHPQKGAEIMAPIAQMQSYIPGIRFHHETMSGTGYPLGLTANHIPVEARIVQVADTFDAMTTDRPYQKAMELHAALARIQSLVGKRYDQRVVDALKRAVSKGAVVPGAARDTRVEV